MPCMIIIHGVNDQQIGIPAGYSVIDAPAGRSAVMEMHFPDGLVRGGEDDGIGSILEIMLVGLHPSGCQRPWIDVPRVGFRVLLEVSERTLAVLVIAFKGLPHQRKQRLAWIFIRGAGADVQPGWAGSRR
jgi:hypothetical protein